MSSSWPGRLTALVLLVGVVTGCTAESASPLPASPTLSQAPATAEASQTPPSPSATLARTPDPTVIATPPAETLAPPPAATLVAGTTRQPGEPGSWAMAGGTSSAPWLPVHALDPVEVPQGPLTVELEGDLGIASWTAQAATAEDTLGERLTSLGEGSGTPAFHAPSAGAWVVAVEVRFAGNQGSASYYWHVVVT